MRKPPVTVIVVSLLLIAAGLMGVLYHAQELNLKHPFQNGAVWLELIRVTAIVCGVYLLRGRDWARWPAMIWIGFHVVVRAFHPLRELILHAFIFTLFAYVLFRPPAKEYFRTNSEH